MTEAQPRLLGVVGAQSAQGRNVVSLNLGVAIAQLGRRTVIADLAGSDLRWMLGLFRNVKGLREFAQGEYCTIRSFVAPTPAPNLWIVGPGQDTDDDEPTRYSEEQKVRLMRALATLDADFVLADLGTDLTPEAAESFSMANAGILVVSADPRQILGCYEFLKVAVYGALRRRLGPDSETEALLAQIQRAGGPQRPTIAQVTGLVRRRNPDEARVIDAVCDSFVPMLIVDAGRSLRDMELGAKLRAICRRYLSVRTEYLGFIYEDTAVDQSYGVHDPVLLRGPDSRAAVAMHRIAHKIIQSPRLASARAALGLAAGGAGRVPKPAGSAAADDAIKEVLAHVVTREISEVEDYLAEPQREPESEPQLVTTEAERESGERVWSGTGRMLKAEFSPADLRALQELIESLDDGVLPDAKWKWKARALTAPSRVVHHLMSKGIRRGFFYREGAATKARTVLA